MLFPEGEVWAGAELELEEEEGFTRLRGKGTPGPAGELLGKGRVM